MGLLRRKLSKEFKMTALRQLDSGVSIAAVARGCEIDASLLHRWRRPYSVRLADPYWQTGHRQTRLRVQDTDPAQTTTRLPTLGAQGRARLTPIVLFGGAARE